MPVVSATSLVMEFIVNGKIKKVLKKKEGVSDSGYQWVSQGFIFETPSGEPAFSNIFGKDAVEEYAIQEGDSVSVTYEVILGESKKDGSPMMFIKTKNVIAQAGNKSQKQKRKREKNEYKEEDLETTAGHVDANSLPF